jgi:hypothetical protein
MRSLQLSTNDGEAPGFSIHSLTRSIHSSTISWFVVRLTRLEIASMLVECGPAVQGSLSTSNGGCYAGGEFGVPLRFDAYSSNK